MSANIIPFTTTNQTAETRRGFKSFKTSSAIQYTQRCCRDGLIQATLDPDVTALFPYEGPAGPADMFFTFGVQIREQTCLVALCDATNGATFAPPPEFSVGLSVSRDSILAEPFLTATRTIWSKREVLVPPLFSVRLLKRLDREPTGLALGTLEDELVDEPKRWVDYILAMACRGLLTVDCRRPLTDLTEIKPAPLRRDWPAGAHWIS